MRGRFICLVRPAPVSYGAQGGAQKNRARVPRPAPNFKYQPFAGITRGAKNTLK